MIGTTVSHYRILEKLGAGGMGEVHLAEDTKLDRRVALKMLPSELADDEERLKRFEREAKAVARLAHPNILDIHELGEHEGRPFMVTELLEGETLQARLDGRSIGWRRAIEIGAAIADGLAAAHQAGIIHRDLKPSNLFLTSDGRVKILDFGLARYEATDASVGESLIPTTTDLTDTGTVLGTVGYMAPEQVRGEPADPRADIFALGCILYEMLSGSRAFVRDTPADTIAAILKEEPPELSRTGAVVPVELERTIGRCLEKHPQSRFQSASDLAFALRSHQSTPDHVATSGEAPRIRDDEAEPSIAVLPFSDMSPEKDQDYFCEGMAEEIINGLSQLDGLRVTARTSAFAFKDRPEDIRTIGGTLGVDTVLEGSIRKAGNRLRITVQLINVADGYHMWSRRFDREMEDVFEIQDEISLAVVDNLKVKLVAPDRARLVRRFTENPEALNLYLQGRYFWNRRSEVGLKKALDYFQKAVDIDPTYALPHVGFADTFIHLANYGFVPPGESYARGRAAATKALEIDDTIGEAHASLGWIHTHYDWDWRAAEREFQRSLELSPAYAWAHLWYGIMLGETGRFDEAIERAGRAQQLDPVSPIITAHAGVIFYLARRYDEAIEQLQRTIELEPGFVIAHTWLALVYQAKGMQDEASRSVRTAGGLAGDNPSVLGYVGWGLGVTGHREDALRILERLDRLETERYVSPVPKGLVCLGLDRKAEAFDHFDRAVAERDSLLVSFWGWPLMDSVRSDPRFEDLVRRIGLPEA
jgi:serine/threonine protein kinase/tetratricopeptide (TPR) repeat protein